MTANVDHRDRAQEQRAAHPECGDALPADHRDVPGAEPGGPAGARSAAVADAAAAATAAADPAARRRAGGAPGSAPAAPPVRPRRTAGPVLQRPRRRPQRPSRSRRPPSRRARQRAAAALAAATPAAASAATARAAQARRRRTSARSGRRPRWRRPWRLRPEHDTRRAPQADRGAAGADDARRARAVPGTDARGRRRGRGGFGGGTREGGDRRAAAGGNGRAARPARCRRGATGSAGRARRQGGRRRRPGATTIDSLFGPLPVVESRGTAWQSENKQLKPIRLRLGVSDGTLPRSSTRATSRRTRKSSPA